MRGETPPMSYYDWNTSDYSFYDTLAQHLHDAGLLCEPDSREPWLLPAAHNGRCLADILAGFETAVDRTLESLGKPVGATSNAG